MHDWVNKPKNQGLVYPNQLRSVLYKFEVLRNFTQNPGISESSILYKFDVDRCDESNS